jgi:UDP-N-acetylglucosamine enolpyruvyl transferase
MDRICGGQPLSVKIKLGGAKNTTLQLLTDGFLIVSNVPNLADNQTMSLLLELQGEAVEPVTNDGFKLPFAGSISDTETPYKLIRGHVPGAGISARVDERGPRVAVRRLYRHAR